MLAISLLELNLLTDATAEAQQAVGLAPDLPYAHYALAFVLYKRNWLDEAQKAAAEAVRLESFNPNHFCLLGSIELERRNWPTALAQADRALQIDPGNTWATNLRAMALVKLGRRDEAATTMGQALARDPENATSHANQGWTLLHRGDHKQARIHFREALRLDPTLDWAKQGMVEALKSGFWPYKLLLLFWLWMARVSARLRWGVVLGGFFGSRLISMVATNNPALGKVLWPIFYAYLVFAVSSWLAGPLLNLILRLHPFGRYALSREQVIESNVIGGLLLIALGALSMWVTTAHVGYLVMTVAVAMLIFPVAAMFDAPVGWPRTMMLVVTICLALVAILLATMPFVLPDNQSSLDVFQTVLYVFVGGIIFCQLAGNALPMFRPKR